MGPPPCAPRPGLGVVGIGPGVRAFLDVAAVARVPVVGPRHPCGGLPGPVDAGQFPDAGEQFAAGLAPGVARQVGERVAQRVHQAALHRRARPHLGRGPQAGGGAVAHQQARRCQWAHQRAVGGRVLLVAPLPSDGAAVLVDRDQHAPPVRHVRAVHLDEPVGHAIVAQTRTHVPAPVDGAQERAPAYTDRRGRRLHGGRARHPAQERMELGHPGAVLAPAHAAGVAGIASPALLSRRGCSVLAHRRAAHVAQPRPR